MLTFYEKSSGDYYNLLKNSAKSLSFHSGDVNYEKFLCEYNTPSAFGGPNSEASDWLGRKILAPFKVIFCVVELINHLARAIFGGAISYSNTGSYSFAAKHLFNCARDIEEIFGHLLTIVKDEWGLYLVQEAQFQKKCYDKFSDVLPSENISSKTLQKEEPVFDLRSSTLPFIQGSPPAAEDRKDAKVDNLKTIPQSPAYTVQTKDKPRLSTPITLGNSQEFITAKSTYEQTRVKGLANVDTYNTFIKAAGDAKEYIDAKSAYNEARYKSLANVDTYNTYITVAGNAKEYIDAKFAYNEARNKSFANVDTYNNYIKTAGNAKEYIDAKFAYEEARNKSFANVDTYNNYITVAGNAKEYIDAKFAYEEARSKKLANVDTYNNYIKKADNAKKYKEAKQAEEDKKIFEDAQKKESLNSSSHKVKIPEIKEKVEEIKPITEIKPLQPELRTDGKLSPLTDVKQLYRQFEIPTNHEQVEAQKKSFAKLSTKIVCMLLEGKINTHEFLLGYLSDEHFNTLDFNKIPLENIELFFTPALLNPYAGLSNIVDCDITSEHKQQNLAFFNKFTPAQQKIIKTRLEAVIEEYFPMGL